MGKISQYSEVPVPKLSDLLIGTSIGLNEEDRVENQTYNFSLQQLLDLFIPNLPSNNLQGVLDIGNTATQDINLFGKITTEDLEVTNEATFNKANFPGEMYLSGLLYDNTYESGAEGDVLSRSADGVKWITLPPIFTPSLQQVLNVGNTSTTDIILNAQLTADDIDVDNIIVNSSIELSGSLKDSSGSSGLLGQVLTSNGSGEVVWGAGAVYTGVAPIVVNSVIKEISITKSDSTHDGYLSSGDWIAFDSKQDALSGTGLVKSTAGVITYITDNSANWDDAYENTIVSAEVTGTTTKTLTLTQRDLGTITASWSDYDTAPVTSVFGRTGDVVAQSGDYTTTQVTEGTNLYYLDSRARAAISLTTTGSSGPATYNSSTGVLNIPDYGGGLTGYVPYTGATSNVNLGEYGLTSGFLTFDTTPTGTPTTQGTIYWDDSRSTVALIMNGTTQNIGQDTFYYVKNSSGSLIPKGTAVRFAGTDGASGHILITPFLADGTYPSTYFMGVTSESIANGSFGQVMQFGEMEGIDTSAYTAGSLLYASTTVAGGYQTTAPVAPNNIVLIAATLNSKNNGAILVRPTYGSNINDDEGVLISSPTNNQGLFYNSATGLWVNKTIAQALGYTPISLTSLSASSPLSYNNTTGSFSIQQATGSQSGYLSSTDWNTFNNKQNALTNPITGSLTANYLPKASGSTTLVNSLFQDNGLVAGIGALDSGFLFNVSGAIKTYGLTSLGAIVGNLTGNADTATALASPRTFTIGATGKTFDGTANVSWTLGEIGAQAAGNYITSLTGEATASGPGAASVTLTNSAVTGKVLTGVNITGGSISSTDSILTAFGKVQNQINGLIGGSIYQGTWNASTNTPSLASGVGTKGYYYIVSVAGSTNLDGITDWNVGDWAIFDGTAWQQVDNTDAVVSVNGFTGIVNLTTANVPEATNLYYTDARSRAALSFTAGSGAYNSTTGVIKIPTNTNQLTNGANFITLASLSASSPLSYNNGTGAFSITQANSTTNGFLSSTDWNTFNNKQNALTNPITGTGTTDTLPKFTGSTTLGNSNITDSGTQITLNSATTVNGFLGIGTTTPNISNVRISTNLTGGTAFRSLLVDGSVQSDVTSEANYFQTSVSTQAASFTISNLRHYQASQGTIGAGSAITVQSGFEVRSSLIGAVNNYGFRGSIPSGTGRWNLYMDGTASNYIEGSLGVGTTSLTHKLTVTGNGAFSYNGPEDDIVIRARNTSTTGFSGFVAQDDTGSRFLTLGVQNSVGKSGAGYGNVGEGVVRTSTSATGLSLFATTGAIRFSSDATERMRITSTGIGQNTTSVTSLYTTQGTTATNAPTLGSELLSSTGWTSTDWTGDFSTGFTHTTGNTSVLSNTLAAVVNASYSFAITITGRTAGSIIIDFGGQTSQTITATGAYGVFATTTGNLQITPTSDFNGTVILSIRAVNAAVTPFSDQRNSGGTVINEMRFSPDNSSIYIGTSSGRVTNISSSSNNTALGSGTLQRNISGTSNTAIGQNALRFNISGVSNTAVGQAALANNTTGNVNNAFGNQALIGNTTGTQNNGFGTSALSSNTTGNNNVAFGHRALFSNTTGNNNTAIGNNVLSSNTVGISNVAIGASSGQNSSGSSNTFVGASSGTNTTSNNNAFFGQLTGNANTSGGTNSFFGQAAGQNNTTGGGNNFFGNLAASFNTTGSNNIAIGVQAARFIADGITSATVLNDSIFIGVGTRANADNQTNQIVIGRNAIGLGSNTTVIGNTSTVTSAIYGRLLLGTTTDNGSDRLQVTGNGLFTGTLEVDTVNNGVGDFLTRTAGGIITRRTASEVRTDIGAIGGSGTTNYLSKFTASGTIGNSLIFDNGTNVGIGTTNPNFSAAGRTVLDINGTSNTMLCLSVGGTAGSYLYQSSGNLNISNEVNGDIINYTGGSERMRITSSGNVGIGTTSPSAKLDVVGGEIRAGNGTIIGGISYSTRPEIGAISNHNLGIITNNITRMLIDTNGNVGIGSVTAPYRLFVSRNGTGNIAFFSNENDADLAINLTSGVSLISPTTGILAFGTSSSEKMRLDSSGRLGIGTSSPSYKLQVVGSTVLVGATRISASTTDLPAYTESGWVGYSGSTLRHYLGDGSGYDLRFAVRNAGVDYDRVTIKDSGFVGLGTTTPATKLDVVGAITASGGFFNSDIRLKDIIDYEYSVSDIKPITYTWKDKRDDKKHIGYSAQEVQKVMPNAVNEDAEGMLSVNYIEILVAKIEMLEKRIKQLENGLE